MVKKKKKFGVRGYTDMCQCGHIREHHSRTGCRQCNCRQFIRFRYFPLTKDRTKPNGRVA